MDGMQRTHELISVFGFPTAPNSGLLPLYPVFRLWFAITFFILTNHFFFYIGFFLLNLNPLSCINACTHKHPHPLPQSGTSFLNIVVAYNQLFMGSLLYILFNYQQVVYEMCTNTLQVLSISTRRNIETNRNIEGDFSNGPDGESSLNAGEDDENMVSHSRGMPMQGYIYDGSKIIKNRDKHLRYRTRVFAAEYVLFLEHLFDYYKSLVGFQHH